MLNSFQHVEDYLATVRVYSHAVLRQQEAVETSQELLKLEVVRYESGFDSYLDVLIAQTKLLTNQQNPAVTLIEESVGAVDLVQALGGGWDRSQLQTPAQVSEQPAKADYKKQD